MNQENETLNVVAQYSAVLQTDYYSIIIALERQLVSPVTNEFTQNMTFLV